MNEEQQRYVRTIRTALAQGHRAMNELLWTHADIRASEALDELVASMESKAAADTIRKMGAALDRSHARARRLKDALQQAVDYMEQYEDLPQAMHVLALARQALGDQQQS